MYESPMLGGPPIWASLKAVWVSFFTFLSPIALVVFVASGSSFLAQKPHQARMGSNSNNLR